MITRRRTASHTRRIEPQVWPFQCALPLHVLRFALLGAISLVSSAQAQYSAEYMNYYRHETATVETFHDWHFVPNPVLQELGQLRETVRYNLWANNPTGNVMPLLRITLLNPHDYIAWELLGQTYAILGDATSAANVDLTIVALFEYVPFAFPQVNGASARLTRWDPCGWRTRVVTQRQGGCLPVIPPEVYERFLAAQPILVHNSRSVMYRQIEESLTTYDTRVGFIDQWSR